MKNFFTVTLLFCLLLATQAAPAFAVTHFKISLVPGVAYPETTFVSGVDFGLFANKTDKVNGVQVSLLYSGVTKHSIGVQASLVNISEDFDGGKWGLVSISRNFRGYQSGTVCLSDDVIGYQGGLFVKARSVQGLQAGLINVTDDMSGVQLGLVNYTGTMNGLQVGLVNIIKQSSLPVMIIANWVFK